MLTCRIYIIIYIAYCFVHLSRQYHNKGVPEAPASQYLSGELEKLDVSKNVGDFYFNKLPGRLKKLEESIWNNQSISRIFNNLVNRRNLYSRNYSTSSDDNIGESANQKQNETTGKIIRHRTESVGNHAAQDFRKHRIIYPRVLHSRTKRALDHTWDRDGHHNHIVIGFSINGEDIMVNLQLNRELLTRKYYERQVYGNGSHVIHHPSPQDSDMCHYQGFIKDKPRSWAAISTCDGISGVLFDGSETHYVEPIDPPSSVTSQHYLLGQSDLIDRNYSCGYNSSSNSIHDLFHDDEFSRLLRYKRSAETDKIRGPFNSNSLSRYVELFLVMDKTEFEKYNSDEKRIYRRCKAIANIVNALYQPLNIFIALTGVEIWKEKDQAEISTDGDKTLTNFLQYRKLRLIPNFPNDNAQLLTGKLFDSGVVGKALKGPICTYQYSGGVNMDHSESVGLVATTVAHEMGHNFGMEHDTDDCKCPDKRCIMAPSSGTKSPSHWSSCSQEYLAISFERSMDYCLRNRPTSLFQSPVCGNGFVEPGEQCDCGLPQHCDNPCCNASSCMLFSNATCATGRCCDLTTCSPKIAGTECRISVQLCDLPEYCSGDSEYCPADVYKENGMECKAGREKAYCYEGMCRTHEHQCRLLWGPTGKNSHDRCYKLNLEGNTNGNCGYNWTNDLYKKCNFGDIKCGMMHCKHFNERLEFGMESVSKVSHRFIADKSQGIIPCRVAQVDLGLDMVDPGLAPDGAKCGYNKMCLNQRCMSVASLKLNACECNGRGVCNNKGHCHCKIGFAWPDCLHPGLGGSEDSGPASNPHATSKFVAVMFIFFLGIVPCGIIICLLYYARVDIKLWLIRKGKSPPRLPVRSINQNVRPKSVAIDVANKIISSKTTSNSAGSSPSQGSKSNSPLLNGYANGEPANFQCAFFGKHEGFTLSPIKEKSVTVVDESSKDQLKQKEVLNKGINVKSPTGGLNKALTKRSNSIQSPTGSVTAPKREISQPSLCASTNPAVGVPNSTILRPAPKIPPVAVVSPCRRAPARPLSVPDATTLIVRHDPSLESDSDRTKEQKQSAVARFASFLSKREKPDSVTDSPNSNRQCNTLPRKASKINRENLMHMEISPPMQLQATELPSNLVPVRAAPEPPKQIANQNTPVKECLSPTKVSFAADVKKEGQGQSFSRIGSVREQSVTIRPSIPKFGSMRAPRPKSLPPTRPSQPPPRPPLPKIPTSESDYFYEDCVSLQRGNRTYDEQSSPQESIYATIDDDSPISELPTVVISEKKPKKSLFSRFYYKSKKQPEDVEVPKEPLYCNIEVDVQVGDEQENSLGQSNLQITADDNGGLLSEIVTELANREPKYVNTLSADEKQDVEEKVKYANIPESPINSPKIISKSIDFKEPERPSVTPNLNFNSKPRGVLSYLNKTKSEDSAVTLKNESDSLTGRKLTHKSSDDESFPRSYSTPFPKSVTSTKNTSVSKPINSISENIIGADGKSTTKSAVIKSSTSKVSRPGIKTQTSVPLPTQKEKIENQRKPNSVSMPKISAKLEPTSQLGKKTVDNVTKPFGIGKPRPKTVIGSKNVTQKTTETVNKDKPDSASKNNLTKKTLKPDPGQSSAEKLKEKGRNLKGPTNTSKKGDVIKTSFSSSRSGVLAAAAKAKSSGNSNVAALQQKFEKDSQKN